MEIHWIWWVFWSGLDSYDKGEKKTFYLSQNRGNEQGNGRDYWFL